MKTAQIPNINVEEFEKLNSFLEKALKHPDLKESESILFQMLLNDRELLMATYTALQDLTQLLVETQILKVNSNEKAKGTIH